MDTQSKYYVRRDDGLVQYASTGSLVLTQSIAARISDDPAAWYAIEVDEFPTPIVVLTNAQLDDILGAIHEAMETK